jgi:hypothetical protein
MRVGLYFHNYTPVSGGAYTFQLELLKAISESPRRSAHQFLLLAYPQNGVVDHRDLLGSLQFAPIEQPSSSSVASHSRQKGWLKLGRKRVVPAPAEYQGLSALDQAVRKNGIEFVWFLTPAYELTDAPYIATVWDLQHRLQPWFPEVGNSVE